MTAVAIGIWVFSHTGLTTPLLLTAFFTELPGMLGSSLAGVLVDRWPRKHVMILADLGQAVGSLILLASFLSGAFQLWHLYSISLLQGVFSILQGPAENATITLLIPEGHRERANGIQELTFPLAGVLAPMLTGLVYGLIGIGGVIAIDLVTFVIAAGVVTGLAIPQPTLTAEGQAGRGNFLAEWRGGLRFFKTRPALFVFAIYLTVNNFLLNGPLDLSIPYLIAVTGDEKQMGLVMGLMSLGAFTGGLLVAYLGKIRPRMRLMLLITLFNGLLFLAYGTARSLPGLAISLFLLMIPLPMGNALYRSILQVKTPPDLQGRVFAVMDQFYLFGSTTSFLLIGPLVDRLVQPRLGTPGWERFSGLVGSGPGAGMGLVLFVTGLLILLTSGLVFSLRSVRNLEADLPEYPQAEEARAA